MEGTEVQKSQIKGKESENQRTGTHKHTETVSRYFDGRACPLVISSIPGKSFHSPFP